MRATVLCVLALVGATCALQIPSRASRLSILGIPLPNLGGDDSSSSSSSSEEDPSTIDLATDLAQRLIQDIEHIEQELAKIGMLPLHISSSAFEMLTNEVKNWLSGIRKPDNSPIDGNTVVLATNLIQSVVKDVDSMATTIVGDLLQPVKMKADLFKILIRDISRWLKKILPNGGRRPDSTVRPSRPSNGPTSTAASPSSRPSSPVPPSSRPTQRPPHGSSSHAPSSHRPTHHPPHGSSSHAPSSHRPTHRPPHGSSSHAPSATSKRPGPTTPRPNKPTSKHPNPSSAHPGQSPSSSRVPDQKPTQRPRPSPPHGHRPSSPQRPKPTPPHQPSSTTEKSANGRNKRDIQISISGNIDVDKLQKALANVDFSKVTKAIPRIPDLTQINKLPRLPGLEHATKEARKLLIGVLDAGAATVPKAIETALNLAVKSANPSSAIVEVVNIILKTYLGVAQSIIAISPAAIELMREAAIIVGNVVSVVLSVLSASVAAGVQALL